MTRDTQCMTNFFYIYISPFFYKPLRFFCYWCYYLHTATNSVSPLCRIFTSSPPRIIQSICCNVGKWYNFLLGLLNLLLLSFTKIERQINQLQKRLFSKTLSNDIGFRKMPLCHMIFFLFFGGVGWGGL